MDTICVKHCFCVAESCGLCGIRMKETYFCTKTKKIQKKSQKCTENHGNEKSKCDLYGLRYRLCQGGFFCSGYRSLIGKVLRFFSLKFRSLGGLVAESILMAPTIFSLLQYRT